MASGLVLARLQETVISVCSGGTRKVALDDLNWGEEPMLHRLRLHNIDKFPNNVLRIDSTPGAQAFTITPGTTSSVTVSVTGQIVETGKLITTTMLVEVWPASNSDGEVCLQLSGTIFCDGSPRNLVIDKGEPGFQGIHVMITSDSTMAGSQHYSHTEYTNSQGQWWRILYVPPGQWTHRVVYTYSDQSTEITEVTKTSTSADYIVLESIPVPSLGVCEITQFRTLLLVINDCRCRIVDISGVLTADVADAPVVINRPVTLIGMDGATIDATSFPAEVPVFVAEGMNAEFGMKTMTILTKDNRAIVLEDGKSHQIVATTFTFDTASAIVLASPIPMLEISWCIFDITTSTHALPEAVYAIDNAADAWGEDSVLLRNSVHTPTCLDEKLFLTQQSPIDSSTSDAVADILFTHLTCGIDNKPSDPCVYGISNSRSGVCECEYGCNGGLCSHNREPANPFVYVCYFSHKLKKQVPLELDISKAEMLMNGPDNKNEDDEQDPLHYLRDECEETKYIPNGFCKKFRPRVEYQCNCGAPGDYNHTVTTSDLQQVLSEVMGVILLARRAEVQSYEKDNEAYRNAYWLLLTFEPVFMLIVLSYIISQVEAWSYEYKIESAVGLDNGAGQTMQ